jgi:hypothetical protein
MIAIAPPTARPSQDFHSNMRMLLLVPAIHVSENVMKP